MTRILGIDPGFERLGVAIVERKDRKESVIFSECFKTSAKLEFPEGLKLLGSEVKRVIKKWKPEVLAIETLFLNTNQKTAMHVAEARGVVMYEAVCAGLKIFEATPLQIKIAVTGHGRSDKTQIMKILPMLVKIEDGKKLDDEMDAIAIALTAFAHMRF